MNDQMSIFDLINPSEIEMGGWNFTLNFKD